MPNRLFVYGTFAPGRTNAHYLEQIPGRWNEASVQGQLLQQGWGMVEGCPAIKLDSSARPVNGHLFCSDHLDDLWDWLDAFEGNDYERVVTQVTLTNGETLDAFIYQFAHA